MGIKSEERQETTVVIRTDVKVSALTLQSALSTLCQVSALHAPHSSDQLWGSTAKPEHLRTHSAKQEPCQREENGLQTNQVGSCCR